MTSPSTDLDRWANAERLASDWDRRCDFVARFVRPGLRIIDIGCGRMAVERLFAPSAYVPVDVVARDARTKVIDLNVQPLPTAWVNGMQLATMLGVFEYLTNPRSVMAGLASQGIPLLASYNCTELAPDAPRADLGWVNAYDIAGIEAQKFDCRSQFIGIFYDRAKLTASAPTRDIPRKPRNQFISIL